MASSIASRFKLRPLYGLPTWRGLLLLCVVGASIWFSLIHRSGIERWIFVLMILLLLIHLAELNDEFRSLSFSVLPFDPAFAGEGTAIPIRIASSGPIAAENLSFKFEGAQIWTAVPRVGAFGAKVVHLPLFPKRSGVRPLPDLRVRMRPFSGLFGLWQVLEFGEALHVLPRPLDHRATIAPPPEAAIDAELSELEPIRDSRLMARMDQKLFLKTGLPYLRSYEGAGGGESISMLWSDLDALTAEKRAEQFSFWIKAAREAGASTHHIDVDAPFFKRRGAGSPFFWRELMRSFSEWLHGQA